MKNLLHKKISWPVAAPIIGWFASLAIVLNVWMLPRESHYEQAQRNTVLVETPHGTGSGVVVRRSNRSGQRVFLLTNAHVVRGQDKVTLRQAFHFQGQKLGEQVFQGEVLARSSLNDLALVWLHAPADLFPGVDFDAVTPLPIGAAVYHVGNWLRVFDGSLSTGVISQSGVALDDWPWAGIDIDQTTAIIIPGSSGGPVFNAENHRLAGLACGWAHQPGVGFFIPVRQMAAWTHGCGLEWVMTGTACPNDLLLQTMATLESASLIKVEPAPEILRILLGPEPESEPENEDDHGP